MPVHLTRVKDQSPAFHHIAGQITWRVLEGGQGAHPPSTTHNRVASTKLELLGSLLRATLCRQLAHTTPAAHASGVPECLAMEIFYTCAGPRCLSVSLPQISLDGLDSFSFSQFHLSLLFIYILCIAFLSSLPCTPINIHIALNSFLQSPTLTLASHTFN
ncbi:hypothetical protein GGI35DRAFT_368419 [Trichoderma velutinum]